MAKKSKGTRGPAKAEPKATKSAFGAKAAFIRSHPNLAAKEIVDRAGKAGLKLTVNHVYNVRSTSGISKGRKPAAQRAAKASAPTVSVRKDSTEAQFRRLVIQLGVDRARAVLSDVEVRLAALIAG